MCTNVTLSDTSNVGHRKHFRLLFEVFDTKDRHRLYKILNNINRFFGLLWSIIHGVSNGIIMSSNVHNTHLQSLLIGFVLVLSALRL